MGWTDLSHPAMHASWATTGLTPVRYEREGLLEDLLKGMSCFGITVES